MNKYQIFYEQTIRVNNASWLAVSKVVSILKQRPRNPCKIRGSGVRVIIPTHLVLQKFVKKRCKTGASEGSKLPF